MADNVIAARFANRLLAQLAPSESAGLGLEKVPLSVGQILEAPDTPIAWVHFVESGLVSVVETTQPHHRIEVAMIGFEGMTGSAAVLGDDQSASEHIVQSAGEAFRISVPDLRAAMLQHPALAPLFLRYVSALLGQASHTALANGRGLIGERLARWLLMWQDRLQRDELAVSHEFLSDLLGVRRSGVTVALHVLEGERLIKASRKLVRVLDREGLLILAKGFYGHPEAQYDRLMGPLLAPHLPGDRDARLSNLLGSPSAPAASSTGAP